MLEDDTSPVVSNPALLNGFDEWYTESCAKYQHGIAECQCNGVAGEEGSENKWEG